MEREATKIINLFENTRYKQSILKTKEYLDEFQYELYSCMINIATNGKWKKWSNEQEEGTEFDFTYEMLSNTGDNNVDLLLELYENISDTIERLKT